MNEQSRGLRQIQRWMQTVIMHPGGITEGIASGDARSQIDVAPEDVETVIERSRALTSIERLQVYGNAYYARLLEVLGEEFPALRHAVGEDAFNGFAFGYLQAYPSRSYTLADLAADFPRYLEETRPADDEGDASDEGANWIDFVIDLARLERTYSEVFDAAGPEKGDRLRPEDVDSIPPERWPEARLVPVDCLRLMTFRFPVHEYASAVRRRGENARLPEPAETHLAINRRDYVVRRRPLLPVQYELLGALVEGCPLGEAIERAVAAVEVETDRLAAALQGWFREWSAAQFFRAVELPE